MEYPEEIYATRDGGMLIPMLRSSTSTSTSGVGWGRRHAYNIGCARGYQSGYEAGKAEQSDYIESMSSLESVLIDVEQLEGEDLPFVKSLIERTVRAVRAEQADPLEGYSNLTAAIKSGEPIDYEKLDGLKVQCVNPDVGTLRGVLMRNSRLKPDTSDAWWGDETTASYVNALYDGWSGKDGWTLYVEGEVPLRRKTADELEVGTYFLGETREKKIAEVYIGEIFDSKVVLYTPRMGTSALSASEWVVLEEYGSFQKPEGE